MYLSSIHAIASLHFERLPRLTIIYLEAGIVRKG